MGLSAMAGPLIAAGSNLLGNALGMASQGNMNYKNRAFASDMYLRQRKDAITDWQVQNEYDSPRAQMERLRQAGLNPNLVYKNGADNTSGPIRATSASVPDGKAFIPDFSGVGNSILSYYDIKVKEAQADNLRDQQTVIKQDAALKAAQTVATLASTEQTKFDTGLKADLRETSLQAAKAALQKTYADTEYVLSNNERQTALASANVAEAAERILSSRLARTKVPLEKAYLTQQIRSIKADVKLKEMGINPNDPTWMRVLGQAIDPAGVKEWLKSPDKTTRWPSAKDSIQVIKQNNPYQSDSVYRKFNQYQNK